MLRTWYYNAPSVCREAGLASAHFKGVHLYQRRERQYSVCLLNRFPTTKTTDGQSESSRSFVSIGLLPRPGFHERVLRRGHQSLRDWHLELPVAADLHVQKTMAEKETKQDKKASIVAGTLHKSSGSAVPAANPSPTGSQAAGDYNYQLSLDDESIWYVAVLSHQKYTVSGCEYIEKTLPGSKCFVPAKEEWKVYPNRTRRKVRKYVIPRMIFVTGTTEAEAYSFAPQCPYVDYFLPDRAKKRTGRVRLAEIPHSDLVKLQNAINGISKASDIEFTTEHLHFDDTIQVVQGSLAGMEGGYFTDGGKDYLLLMIGNLGNIKVKVSKKDCILTRGRKKA